MGGPSPRVALCKRRLSTTFLTSPRSPRSLSSGPGFAPQVRIGALNVLIAVAAGVHFEVLLEHPREVDWIGITHASRNVGDLELRRRLEEHASALESSDLWQRDKNDAIKLRALSGTYEGSIYLHFGDTNAL